MYTLSYLPFITIDDGLLLNPYEINIFVS